MPVTNIRSATLPRMIPRISVLLIDGSTGGVGKGPSVQMESDNPPWTVRPSVSETRRDGRRFVLMLYAVIVGIAGFLGVVLGEVVELSAPPRLFFLVSLPPNGAGFAVYGMVTVAVVLGLPLALVVYLSDRLDTETA
jgi:hypothetical protein